MPSRTLLLVAVVVPFLIPAAVFLVVGIGSRMGFGGVMTAFAEQAGERRHNPLITGLLGLFPVLLLLSGAVLGRRFDRAGAWIGTATWAGRGSRSAHSLWPCFWEHPLDWLSPVVGQGQGRSIVALRHAPGSRGTANM